MRTQKRIPIACFEKWVRRIGAVAALVTLLSLLAGLRRASGRPHGRETGPGTRLLNNAAYLTIGVGYSGVCALLWRPIRFAGSSSARALALVSGSLLYFSGLGLVLSARLTLGNMYNASSAFGVQLFADHRLVTFGPYAIVRHPIYLGLVLIGVGGILLYRTWTLLFFLAGALENLLLRGRREEQALAAEFGADWEAYCRRVPFILPRFVSLA